MSDELKRNRLLGGVIKIDAQLAQSQIRCTARTITQKSIAWRSNQNRICFSLFQFQAALPREPPPLVSSCFADAPKLMQTTKLMGDEVKNLLKFAIEMGLKVGDNRRRSNASREFPLLLTALNVLINGNRVTGYQPPIWFKCSFHSEFRTKSV